MTLLLLLALGKSMRAVFAGAGLVCAAAAASAQFAMVPSSALSGPPQAAEAVDVPSYRKEAARHVYSSYPMRIHKGKLPPLMYAVMITEADIDASGQVVDVRVVRQPAAATEVSPWVVSLIRKASPFPAPSKIGASVTYREIWLVDRTGYFQVDTLTEGQR